MVRVITVAGLKGGVGKSITAVHLAAYLEQELGAGSTLLVDGDPNATVLSWARGGGLPVTVVSETQAVKAAQNYEYAVLDTKARPEPGYLERLAEGCDFMVLPTDPAWTCLRVLVQTVDNLKQVGRRNGYRALLTLVPPWPNRNGERARRTLTQAKVPLFEGEIRRRQAFNYAVEDGVAVYDLKERAARAGWAEYERVGKELLREMAELEREQSVGA